MKMVACKTKPSQGSLVFDVKWQGYDDPKDQTWEPEENMYVVCCAHG